MDKRKFFLHKHLADVFAISYGSRIRKIHGSGLDEGTARDAFVQNIKNGYVPVGPGNDMELATLMNDLFPVSKWTKLKEKYDAQTAEERVGDLENFNRAAEEFHKKNNQ